MILHTAAMHARLASTFHGRQECRGSDDVPRGAAMLVLETSKSIYRSGVNAALCQLRRRDMDKSGM